MERDLRAIVNREALRQPKHAYLDEVLEHLKVTPPKQARSIETVTRLLDAAEKVLAEEGLDAATVPAIAARAGVSVGVVYRRFPDKDALLRAVWQRFLVRQREQTTTTLAACSAMRIALPDLVHALIRGSIEGHRRLRGLLRALHQYSRAHPDKTFKRTAHELNRANTAVLTAIMLRNRDQIAHPDPERAIEFAMLVIASVIESVIIEDEGSHGLRAPDNLEQELTRMVLGYLGIEA